MLRHPLRPCRAVLWEQWKRVVLPNLGMNCPHDIHEYMVSLLTTDDELARQVHMCFVLHHERTLQSYYGEGLDAVAYERWLELLRRECEALLGAPFNVYDTVQRYETFIDKLTSRFPSKSSACAATDSSELPPPEGSTPMNTTRGG